MKWFKVIINGENFGVENDAIRSNVGFYVTRYVEATDSVAAEALALDIVANEMRAKVSASENNACTGSLKVDEIEQVDRATIAAVPLGYAFYVI